MLLGKKNVAYANSLCAFLAFPYSQLKFWKTHPNSFERILGIVDTKMEDCKKNISILPPCNKCLWKRFLHYFDDYGYKRYDFRLMAWNSIKSLVKNFLNCVKEKVLRRLKPKYTKRNGLDVHFFPFSFRVILPLRIKSVKILIINLGEEKDSFQSKKYFWSKNA